MHWKGNFGNSCEFWRLSLEKPTEIHHNSGVSAVCTNYDGFLWVFPRNVVRIRMNSRNSLYNAPAKKSPIETRPRPPKRPFRTKNAMALEAVVLYYIQGFSNVPWHKQTFWPGTRELFFRNWEKGVLEGGFCKNVGLSWLVALLVPMHCWAQYFGAFFVSFGVTLDPAETPLC